MANPTNPHDQAFATQAVLSNGYIEIEGEHGLSKREFFAALALQGLLANPNS